MKGKVLGGWLIAGLWATSCLVNTQGIPNPNGGGPCTKDSDCTDPCTVHTCTADGVCDTTAISDGTPAQGVTQVPGDCMTITCVGGLQKEEPDEDPPDDHEDCTIDTCSNGKAFHTVKMDGTMCLDLGGSSAACYDGKCVIGCGSTSGDVNCTPSSYCDGVGAGSCVAKGALGALCFANYQCTSANCNAGTCQ